MRARRVKPFPCLGEIFEAHPPKWRKRSAIREQGKFPKLPNSWETGMTMFDSGMDPRWSGRRGSNEEDLAERLEGYIERRASGRIRDLHVVCSDDTIILQGRSRTYHAKQLAQQAVLDLTDGHQVLTNQIVVC